jgi:hypothetical protein
LSGQAWAVIEKKIEFRQENCSFCSFLLIFSAMKSQCAGQYEYRVGRLADGAVQLWRPPAAAMRGRARPLHGRTGR